MMATAYIIDVFPIACAVLPHCRPAGFAAEQPREDVWRDTVGAVLTGLYPAGVHGFLCLLEQLNRDNRLMRVRNNNPVVLFLFHPLLGTVERGVLPALYHVPNKHLILEHGSDIVLPPEPFADKSPVFFWVMFLETDVFCGGEDAFIV